MSREPMPQLISRELLLATTPTGEYEFLCREAMEAALAAGCEGVDRGPPLVQASAQASFCVDRYWTQVSGQVLGVAATNGLGAVPQPGSAAGDENQFVELSILCERMGPRLIYGLSILAATLHLPGRARPVIAWDRLIFATPFWGGIAGAIVKPIGQLQIGGRAVAWWDALPIFHEELALFRREPAAHGHWVDERLDKQDYAAIHKRWERVFDAP